MNTFMYDNLFLTSTKAVQLYRAVCDLPVFDYHCHLSPSEIYEDKVFLNLSELWLSGDHYKWRVMRYAGVAEEFITGDAAPYEKFAEFARILPRFIGNPVYHWTHFELKHLFGISEPLSDKTADTIWSQTLAAMADGGFSARSILRRFGVETLITTDQPTDKLKYHRALAAETPGFNVLPSFRIDKALNITSPTFRAFVAELAVRSGKAADGFDSFVAALCDRLDYFVANGCVAADCSFTDFPQATGDEVAAERAFCAAMDGLAPNINDVNEYRFCLLRNLAGAFTKLNLVWQIHFGVMRNCNTLRAAALGADCGTDSVAEPASIRAAVKLFDAIERDGGLPKTILYALNPTDYYPIATLIGDFAGDSPGRLQLGAAWWFLDHHEGILQQLKTFSETAGLGFFNGMLTDSRSFTSFVRHDYFRRVLCSFVADAVEHGEYPNEAAEKLVTDISFFNAKAYFDTEGLK